MHRRASICRSFGPIGMASMMPGVVRGQTRPEFIALPSTRLPTPSRLAGCRRRCFRLLPGQSSAAGVRNAGRWPGFGSRCGANRIGSTGPADEYPGDAAANAPGGPAFRIAARLGDAGVRGAAPVPLCGRFDDEPSAGLIANRCAGCVRATPRRVCHWERAVVQGRRRTPPHVALPGSYAALPSPVRCPVPSAARARPVRGVTLRGWRPPMSLAAGRTVKANARKGARPSAARLQTDLNGPLFGVAGAAHATGCCLLDPPTRPA